VEEGLPRHEDYPNISRDYPVISEDIEEEWIQAAYDYFAEEWYGIDGKLISGVTHWQPIELPEET
jgi:hypothetical protein